MVYGDRLDLEALPAPRRRDQPRSRGRALPQEKGFIEPARARGASSTRPSARADDARLIQGFVPHQSDASQYTLEELKRFFERVVTKRDWGPLPQVETARRPFGRRDTRTRRPRDGGRVPRRREAHRPPHRRASSRACEQPRQPRLRARTLFDALPALHVPVDAQRDRQGVPSLEGAFQRAIAGRPRRVASACSRTTIASSPSSRPS